MDKGILDNRGIVVDKLGDIKARQFQSPTRSAAAASKARPNILMRINEAAKTIFFGNEQYFANVVNVFIIVNSRSLVFYGLPGNVEPQKVKTVVLQTAKVLISLMNGKWSVNKGYIGVVKEAQWFMRGNVGRLFGVSAEIDSSEKQSPIIVNKELMIHGKHEEFKLSIHNATKCY